MTLPFKRRRLNITNYRKRLKLVSSGKIRFVVRISNKYVNCQFIEYHEDGDKTLVGFNSKSLNKVSFKGGKNLQSAYLSGYFAGLLAIKRNIKEAILDIGLRPSVKNSRVYAALKGALDAGINIPHGEEVLPSDELLKKDELKEIINKINKEVENGLGTKNKVR